MTPETVVAARYLFFLIGVAAFSIACCGLRAYTRDSFRQRAFALRDELFTFAAVGHVDFNDPAYSMLRARMNSVIRFSHRMTFGEAMLPMMLNVVRRRGQALPASYLQWVSALDRQPVQTRKGLEKFDQRF